MLSGSRRFSKHPGADSVVIRRYAASAFTIIIIPVNKAVKKSTAVGK
jgi:hypothetical protein